METKSEALWQQILIVHKGLSVLVVRSTNNWIGQNSAMKIWLCRFVEFKLLYFMRSIYQIVTVRMDSKFV